jgi:hypothetical protein
MTAASVAAGEDSPRGRLPTREELLASLTAGVTAGSRGGSPLQRSFTTGRAPTPASAAQLAAAQLTGRTSGGGMVGSRGQSPARGSPLGAGPQSGSGAGPGSVEASQVGRLAVGVAVACCLVGAASAGSAAPRAAACAVCTGCCGRTRFAAPHAVLPPVRARLSMPAQRRLASPPPRALRRSCPGSGWTPAAPRRASHRRARAPARPRCALRHPPRRCPRRAACAPARCSSPAASASRSRRPARPAARPARMAARRPLRPASPWPLATRAWGRSGRRRPASWHPRAPGQTRTGSTPTLAAERWGLGRWAPMARACAARGVGGGGEGQRSGRYGGWGRLAGWLAVQWARRDEEAR